MDARHALRDVSFAMSSCVIVAPALLLSALSNRERRLASGMFTAEVGATANVIAACAAAPSPSPLVARTWK